MFCENICFLFLNLLKNNILFRLGCKDKTLILIYQIYCKLFSKYFLYVLVSLSLLLFGSAKVGNAFVNTKCFVFFLIFFSFAGFRL